MVVTPNVAEVVRFAGGYLFDRVMAGWDVRVLVADDADARPLRILGARMACLGPVLASPVRGSRPQAIAVHSALWGSDPRVRRMVLGVLGEGAAEVSLWGGPGPADSGEGPGSVCHRLSVAARAFKEQALAAAAVPAEPGEPVELFRVLDLLRPFAST